MANTVNDPDADNTIMESFRSMLIAEGALEAPAQPGALERMFGSSMEKGNSLIERIFGSKGFLDFTK